MTATPTLLLLPSLLPSTAALLLAAVAVAASLLHGRCRPCHLPSLQVTAAAMKAAAATAGAVLGGGSSDKGSGVGSVGNPQLQLVQRLPSLTGATPRLVHKVETWLVQVRAQLLLLRVYILTQWYQFCSFTALPPLGSVATYELPDKRLPLCE